MEPESKIMIVAIATFILLMIVNALLPIPPFIVVLSLIFFFFASSLTEHMDDHRRRLKYEKEVPGPTRWSCPLTIFALLSVILVIQILGLGLQFSFETIAAFSFLGLVSILPWWLGRRISLRPLPRLRTEIEPIGSPPVHGYGTLFGDGQAPSNLGDETDLE
jgi:hypothetical protein